MSSNALMDIKQVANFFGISESTVRRRLRDRKNGEGSFPIPVFGFNRIARWHRVDIESWSEIEPEIIMVETPAQKNRKVESAKKGLAALGVNVSKGTESK